MGNEKQDQKTKQQNKTKRSDSGDLLMDSTLKLIKTQIPGSSDSSRSSTAFKNEQCGCKFWGLGI